MHKIVRQAIQVVNDDLDGTVYVSTGYTNVRGILTPTFAPVQARLQVQAQKHDPLRHANAVSYSNSYLTIYAYGNFSDIQRPTGQGGDVLTFSRPPPNDPAWYYVETVLEWWPDWCAVEVVRQLNAADIATLLKQLQNGANP